MQQIEGAVRRLTNGVRDFARGYTESDIANARRIVNGNITDQDRGFYKTRERKRITDIYFNPPPRLEYAGDSPSVPIFSSGSIEAYQNALAELNRLNTEEIDQLLISQQTSRLYRWGYPIPQ